MILERFAGAQILRGRFWGRVRGDLRVRAAMHRKGPCMHAVIDRFLLPEPRFPASAARGTIVITMSDSSRTDNEHDRLAFERLRIDIQSGFDQLGARKQLHVRESIRSKTNREHQGARARQAGSRSTTRARGLNRSPDAISASYSRAVPERTPHAPMRTIPSGARRISAAPVQPVRHFRRNVVDAIRRFLPRVVHRGADEGAR
jgi:hypothetical protein